jgi:Zn-dependent protease with chaperone function
MQKQQQTLKRVILYVLVSSLSVGLIVMLLDFRARQIQVGQFQAGQFQAAILQGLNSLTQFISRLFAPSTSLQVGGLRLELRLLVLLLPLGLIAGQRQRLLRVNQATLAASWFGYLRLLNWVTLGIWIGWIGLFGLEMTLPEILHGQRSLGQEGQAVLLLVLPPVLAIAGCYALSYRLFNRVGSSTWTKTDLIGQVVWSQLRGMLPLALCFSGCRLFVNHQLPEAMLLFGATYFSQIGLGQLASQANQVVLQALTTGELRDRIFALAQPAGVQLQQVYIMPSPGAVNAFAVQNGNVILTDQLLQHLNKRELDAIIAHELAHLQYKHPQTLQLILLIAICGTLWSQLIWGHWASLSAIPVVAILLLTVYYFYARRFEYEADHRATQLTQDPVAMITGLVKLAYLTRTPFDWGKYTGLFMAHPSLRQRVQAIGQRHGLSGHQLQHFLESQTGNNRAVASTHYHLPEALTQAPILFSSRLKQQISLWLEWQLVLALTVPLAVIAWLQPSEAGRGLYALGWLLALGLAHLTVKTTPSNWAKLRRQLAQKLQQQQLNPRVWNGTFVGLAPDEALRRYEGLPYWDMGFLFLEGDRLCYVGEQTRFALYSTHITQIGLESRSWGGWQTASLVIRWHDGFDSGSFRVYHYESSRSRQRAADLRILKQRLHRWHTQPAWKSTLPQGSDPFVTLTPPQFGAVTSEALNSHLLKQLGNGLIKLLALGLAVCVGLQGSENAEFGLQINNLAYVHQVYVNQAYLNQAYVLGGSVVGLLLQFLPCFPWRSGPFRMKII